MSSGNRLAWRTVVAPTAGAGLIGGAIVGVAESIWVLGLGAEWPGEYRALSLGALLYGLLGGLAGCVIGAAAAVALKRRRFDPLDVFGFGLGGVLAASLLVIFRFRHQRDVLHEFPLGALGQGIWLSASAATGLFCCLVLPRLLRRWTASIGLGRCTLAWLLVVASTAGAARLLPRSGETPFHPPQSAQPPRPHVLYLMVDALRADYLSAYGDRDIETPAMARLARDGIVFEQAISQSSWTRPSVATQLTSLPPHRHGARYKSSSIHPDAVLLTEALAAAGYYCVGSYNNGHIRPQWGFGRGYHRYHSSRRGRFGELVMPQTVVAMWRSWRQATLRAEDVRGSAEQIFRVAREEWDAAPQGAPIFLFVHLMDVHDPYFPRSTGGAAILRDDEAGAAERERFRRAYRDGIEYLDRQLQAFLQWLDTKRLYDDTLIVLVSDHGEEFFEHGGYWHGLTLYDELIHVPLIMKLPQNRLAGSTQAALVRLLDVAPTIADVVGVASPPQWMGLPLIRGGVLVDPQLPYALSETDLEGGTVRALRGTKFKLILAGGRDRRRLPPSALFELEADAGEQANLASARNDQVQRLEAELTTERDGDLWR
ncbi:MAG: sulfatase [Candidatus Binatia bacterium]